MKRSQQMQQRPRTALRTTSQACPRRRRGAPERKTPTTSVREQIAARAKVERATWPSPAAAASEAREEGQEAGSPSKGSSGVRDQIAAAKAKIEALRRGERRDKSPPVATDVSHEGAAPPAAQVDPAHHPLRAPKLKVGKPTLNTAAVPAAASTDREPQASERRRVGVPKKRVPVGRLHGIPSSSQATDRGGSKASERGTRGKRRPSRAFEAASNAERWQSGRTVRTIKLYHRPNEEQCHRSPRPPPVQTPACAGFLICKSSSRAITF